MRQRLSIADNYSKGWKSRKKCFFKDWTEWSQYIMLEGLRSAKRDTKLTPSDLAQGGNLCLSDLALTCLNPQSRQASLQHVRLHLHVGVCVCLDYILHLYLHFSLFIHILTCALCFHYPNPEHPFYGCRKRSVEAKLSHAAL